MITTTNPDTFIAEFRLFGDSIGKLEWIGWGTRITPGILPAAPRASVAALRCSKSVLSSAVHASLSTPGLAILGKPVRRNAIQ
jgi:hypothetical protein